MIAEKRYLFFFLFLYTLSYITYIIIATLAVMLWSLELILLLRQVGSRSKLPQLIYCCCLSCRGTSWSGSSPSQR